MVEQKNKIGPVWVIAEQIDCRLMSVSTQLIGQARKLADQLNTSVETIMLGDDIERQTQQLIAAGADRVYLGDAPVLSFYHPETYTDIIVNLAGEHRPEIILIGSTVMGRELAPLVAARLKTGLTAHCIDLVLDEDRNLEQRIPAYGGLLSIICPQRRPQMATVAGGVFAAPEPDEARSGEIIEVKVPDTVSDRIKTLEIVREEPQGVSLESADIVVAGGAGAGDLAGWKKIAGLANILKGALGSTRPAVDEGWAELTTMIGQSGKMVSPQLYIGVGLSGEQQHLVGVVDAKVMVAINCDDKSPVFDQVDFGIVDDCREFVPVLIQKIEEYLERKVTCRKGFNHDS
jgi:electron transfer flavoprotein alpha subunit